MRDINIPAGGFIRAMPEIELVPVLWAGATPAAHVTRDAFECIAGEIVDAAAENVDAIYLDLHGAMVCQHLDDGEGELLERLRLARFWPTRPTIPGPGCAKAFASGHRDRPLPDDYPQTSSSIIPRRNIPGLSAGREL